MCCKNVQLEIAALNNFQAGNNEIFPLHGLRKYLKTHTNYVGLPMHRFVVLTMLEINKQNY